MAADTGRFGRSESCTYMARLAADIDMRTVEHKSGAEVVKRFLCRRGQLQ